MLPRSSENVKRKVKKGKVVSVSAREVWRGKRHIVPLVLKLSIRWRGNGQLQATAALYPGKEHQSVPIMLEDGWAPEPVRTI